MTLQEIKAALSEGKKVYWSNTAYDVICDNLGQHLIVCNLNGFTTGLTHIDGVTMDEDEQDFFTV